MDVDEVEVWKSICPDPNLLFKIKDLLPTTISGLTDTIQYRKEHLGKSLSLSYKIPLKIYAESTC